MHASLCSILFSIFILTSISVQSQSGELCMTINPLNSFVKIRGEVIDLSKEQFPYCLKMPVGKYELEIWSSGFDIHKKMVEIKPEKTTQFRLGLHQLSSEFKSYKSELKDYHNLMIKRNLGMGVLFAVDVGVTIYTVNVFRGTYIQDAENRLNQSKDAYSLAITEEEISIAVEDYELASSAYNDERKKQNRRLAIAIPSMIAAYGITLWSIKKQKKNKPIKPIFNSANPLISYQPAGKKLKNGTCQIGFSINF